MPHAITPLTTLMLMLSTMFCLVARADKSETSSDYQTRVIASDNGFERVEITSPYQSGKPELRILLPDKSNQRMRRVLFVLPVEAGNTKRWGDGFAQIRQLDLHNKHKLVVVAPTFSQLPWYADHPSDKAVRQESHFIKAVVPYVCKRFGAKAEQCLLVGFSKSGWGAYTLILRHPDRFAAAAAWDAPLMQAKPNSFGMGPIFETQANFRKYHVSALLADADESFKKKTRLVLTGYDKSFRQHHIEVHALMDKHGIKHVYKDGPQRKHHWESGWLPEAIQLLVNLK